MRVAIALVRSRVTLARLREALRGDAEVLTVTTCRELEVALATTPVGSATAVIVEPRDAEGTLTATTIQRLRDGYPSVAVLAHVAVVEASSDDFLAVVRAGPTGLLLGGVDDSGAPLRAALATATSRCTAERAWVALRSDVPAAVHPIVELCLERARQAPSVADLARALGIDRKTLAARLRRAGLPTPQALIGWSRLLLAAQLLEDPARSLEQVALALGFPSASALRNMLARYTGLKARDLRPPGGFEQLIERLRAVVASPPGPRT